LLARPKAGRKDHAVPPATVDQVVNLAMSPPPAGRSRWTTRLLAKQAGHSKRALRAHLDAFMRSWNSSPTPFSWTKPAAAIIRSHRRMLDRTSTAVH
jgi:hypothetical protein